MKRVESGLSAERGAVPAVRQCLGQPRQAYMKSGNLKEAEEYYQKALARDATDQNAKNMLAKLKEPGQK